MPNGHPGDRFLADAQSMLHARFGIGHATLQIEIDPACYCALELASKVQAVDS
jgi:cobalt-zinc-cadmium efflux system protein